MFSKKKNFDFVAIGDITTDAFIRLEDAQVHCNIDKANCELCVRFGDKIPYESVEECVAVGNSPNAAVSAVRLGLNASLMVNMGNDKNGERCLDTLRKNGVNTDLVTIHKGMKTNYHYVLWYEDDRTILVKHEHYDYKLKEMGRVGWIYLSSLGENTVDYHNQIRDFLKNHPDTKLAFQPGTFQINYGLEKFKDLYEMSEVFFCNTDEARKILKSESTDIKNLLLGMAGAGPKNVVITDGPNGAYAYESEKNTGYHMPIYPDIEKPLDRTGAGDAFASTLVSALSLGKSLDEALTWAPINSMSVVQQVGAQKGLLTRAKLEEYLKNAPASYKIEKIF